MSIPNRANDPKRRVNQYGRENFRMLYNSVTAHTNASKENDPKRKAGLYTPGQIAKSEHKAPSRFVPRSVPVRPRSLSEQAPMAKTPKAIHEQAVNRAKPLPNRDIYKR